MTPSTPVEHHPHVPPFHHPVPPPLTRQNTSWNAPHRSTTAFPQVRQGVPAFHPLGGEGAWNAAPLTPGGPAPQPDMIDTLAVRLTNLLDASPNGGPEDYHLPPSPAFSRLRRPPLTFADPRVRVRSCPRAGLRAADLREREARQVRSLTRPGGAP